jgi:hypothetical protein
MNLYTKLLCYLGLIKDPTLDIVQWIKDNPEKIDVCHLYVTSYSFSYKNKSFYVGSFSVLKVNRIEGVFNYFEGSLIIKTLNSMFISDYITPAKRIRKELLE